jgi:3'-phosphoadenosine 5'-phosphosulfate sulfotransferase (PAPS reductase)/FAD synthetase
MKPIHFFVSISGGKDSTATACLAIERAERRDMELRFLFADTGNEHPFTLEHVDYLGRQLGVQIETVRADFSSKFAARRERIAVDWAKELRRKQHTAECKAACEDLAYAEKALLRGECDCPVKISPALPPELIQRAVELMHPTGNPFLDMAMLHGRFPGTKSRFCTDELKLAPMEVIKDAVRFGPDGRPIVEWIGERAQESAARAAKPVLELIHCSFRAPVALYRPIHALTAAEVFAIAKRHGLKPNPLYLMGMSRVGCMPCIMCSKGELLEISRRFPEQLARIAEWERIAGGVARHAYTSLLRGEAEELITSFLPTDKLPDNGDGLRRSAIWKAVEWAKTGRGGRNYDLLTALETLELADEPARCSSAYGLCE